MARACDRMYNQGKAVPWFALLLEALALAPSELFGRFADFLDTHGDADITALQVVFFAGLPFQDPRVASVAVGYHHLLQPFRGLAGGHGVGSPGHAYLPCRLPP